MLQYRQTLSAALNCGATIGYERPKGLVGGQQHQASKIEAVKLLYVSLLRIGPLLFTADSFSPVDVWLGTPRG